MMSADQVGGMATRIDGTNTYSLLEDPEIAREARWPTALSRRMHSEVG